MTIDPFLLSILKDPFSSPALIIAQLVFIILAILKISKTIIKNLKHNEISIVIFSICIFIFSSLFMFYKLLEIPPAGLEIDDAGVVVSGYILKNLGHDLDYDGKDLPYFPFTYFKLHGENKTAVFYTGGLPMYFQALLQYFIKPGVFSLRFQDSLLMILSGLVLIFAFYIFSSNVNLSILFGTLFNLLPWARTLARATPQTTTLCFTSACFIFSILYLLKNKNKFGIVFYLLCLSNLCLSYIPGILISWISSIIIPVILYFDNNDIKNKLLAKKIMLFGVCTLALLYFGFKDDHFFKANMERAKSVSTADIKNPSKTVEFILENLKPQIKQYVGYLSPQFLFFSGDGNLRHNTGYGGQFFVLLVLAFYLGLFVFLFFRRGELEIKMLLIYLLVSFLPASLTQEGALNPDLQIPIHAYRSSAMFPISAFITMAGLLEFYKKRKIFFFIYLVFISINIFTFYDDYLNRYPYKIETAWHSPFGLKQGAEIAGKLLEQNPTIKLFCNETSYTIPYHNLDKVSVDDLINGTGILERVFSFYDIKNGVLIEKGDLFLVKEPYPYEAVTRKYKFIKRIENPYRAQDKYGASLFQILD